MPLQRIYLATTPAGLQALAATGSLGPAPLSAHTITAAVNRSTFGGDEEDQEYAAWLAAAADGRRLVGEGGTRVVVSADVDAALIEDELPEARSAHEEATGEGRGTSVRITSAVPLKRIVAFHVDELPGGADPDLLWFDVTELADVLARLGQG
jgi:hypothetical protein